MKSPFPGMDPYIEACGLWESFHNRLIAKIDEALGPILPQGYTVDLPVRSYIVLKGKGGVAVMEAAQEAESVPMQAFIAETFEESFVEIYAQREERILVTCIEVLSPSNKRPDTEGWQQYERKRQALLLGRANFIEIDLLRGGHRFPMLTPWPKSPYSLLVSRRASAPYCRAWSADFRRPLPPIPVPLLDPDPDLTLDLQPLIDGIYALGRYDEQLDYAAPLTPALSDADAVSVRQLLKEQAPRSTRKGGKPS